ncbi:MAG: hypothetical protein EHM70_08420 [Chloroflexota bacterium]|nr:MAG: hypothetical protein EHM70_08420 [Chloroflexota bacterium]
MAPAQPSRDFFRHFRAAGRRSHFLLSLFFLVLVPMTGVVACGLGSPAVPAPTQTAQAAYIEQLATKMSVRLEATDAAAGPAATATAQAYQSWLDTRQSWPLVLEETFDSNTNEWPTGEESGDLTDISWQVAGGIYHIEATAKEGFYYWTHPTLDEVDDFYLVVDARQVSGPEDSDYGVVFHLQAINDVFSYYAFTLDSEGMYSFQMSYGGEWTTILDWQTSPAIRRYETNRIAVIAEGGHYNFFINDQFVAEADDPNLGHGTNGIVVGMYETGVEAVFEFDNFILRAPLSIDISSQDG